MYCVSDVVFDFCKSDVFVFLVRRGSIGKNGGDAGAKLEIHTVPIVTVLAVASLICLCFDKNKKHTARIAVSAVICIFALAVLFLKLANTEA